MAIVNDNTRRFPCYICGELTTGVYYDPTRNRYYHSECLFQFNSNRKRVEELEAEYDRIHRENEEKLALLQEEDKLEHERWRQRLLRREEDDLEEAEWETYSDGDYRNPATGEKSSPLSLEEMKRYQALLAAWQDMKKHEEEAKLQNALQQDMNAFSDLIHALKEPPKKDEKDEIGGRSITFED